MVLLRELPMPMPACAIFQERRLGATARAKQHRQEACLHRFKGLSAGQSIGDSYAPLPLREWEEPCSQEINKLIPPAYRAA